MWLSWGKSFPLGKFSFGVYPFLGLPSNLHLPSKVKMFFGKFVLCALSLLSFSLGHSERIDRIFKFLEILFQG